MRDILFGVWKTEFEEKCAGIDVYSLLSPLLGMQFTVDVLESVGDYTL